MDNLIQLSKFMFFSDWKTLRKINEAIKDGKVKPLDFGDGTELRKSNPPPTGQEKTMLDKV